MAIFEKTIRNKNFDKLLRKLENEIPDSSWSADLEAACEIFFPSIICAIIPLTLFFLLHFFFRINR